ncbi:MAG: hypothetical protein AAF553_01355 [Pseudomonadota bacterium]
MSPNPAADHTPATPTALATTIRALPHDAARPAQTRFTRALQARFLKRLAECGEVRVAASTLGVSHQTVYRVRRACRVFAQGWDAALLVARERAEDILATRAMHGVEEEVYYHGEVVATRRRYDARLLLAHLARLDRKAEQADIAALADRFDAVIEAFEASSGERSAPLHDETSPEDMALDEPPLGPEALAEVALPEARAEALLEKAPESPPKSTPESASKDGPEGEPDGGADFASRPCNTRSMSPASSRASSRASSQASSRASEAEEPELERRLQAMEAARPGDALTPAQLVRERIPGVHGLIDGPEPLDVGAVESAQLAAFEQGEPEWWLALGEGQRVNECALECAS